MAHTLRVDLVPHTTVFTDVFLTVDQLQLLIGSFAGLETRAPVCNSRLGETRPDAAQSPRTLLVHDRVTARADVLQHDAVVYYTSSPGERWRISYHLRGKGLDIGG